MSAARNLAGLKFGRLTVMRRAGRQRRSLMWVCVCDCGVERSVRGTALTTGNTTSCGCAKRELMALVGRSNGTHRLSRIPEYAVWVAMRHRCYTKKNPRFKYYGALGVSVCDRWRNDFEAFLADVGRRPSPGHSIDRYPDNNGNYEPGNVRWATTIEQRRNRRDFTRGEIACPK
jgi:hypothetical protein